MPSSVCGDRKNPNAPRNSIEGMTVAELREKLKKMRPDLKGIARMKRSELCEELSKKQSPKKKEAKEVTKKVPKKQAKETKEVVKKAPKKETKEVVKKAVKKAPKKEKKETEKPKRASKKAKEEIEDSSDDISTTTSSSSSQSSSSSSVLSTASSYVRWKVPNNTARTSSTAHLSSFNTPNAADDESTQSDSVSSSRSSTRKETKSSYKSPFSPTPSRLSRRSPVTVDDDDESTQSDSVSSSRSSTRKETNSSSKSPFSPTPSRLSRRSPVTVDNDDESTQSDSVSSSRSSKRKETKSSSKSPFSPSPSPLSKRPVEDDSARESKFSTPNTKSASPLSKRSSAQSSQEDSESKSTFSTPMTTNSTGTSESPNAKRGFIKYDNNSCYIDTTLFSLFHNPNVKWVKRTFFDGDLAASGTKNVQAQGIRKEIRRLYDKIHGTGTPTKLATCSTLRKLFADYKKEKAFISEQREPLDVLRVLSDVFAIKRDVKIRETRTSSARSEESVVDKMMPFDSVVHIPAHMLQASKKGVQIHNLIPDMTEKTVVDGVTYTRNTEILEAPFMYISVQRNIGKKLQTPVIPEEEIHLENDVGDSMSCISIIIHHGTDNAGHFTCMFLNHVDKEWYHYNDMNPSNSYDHIGSFDDMLAWKNGFVTKNMVGCVYADTIQISYRSNRKIMMKLFAHLKESGYNVEKSSNGVGLEEVAKHFVGFESANKSRIEGFSDVDLVKSLRQYMLEKIDKEDDFFEHLELFMVLHDIRSPGGLSAMEDETSAL